MKKYLLLISLFCPVFVLGQNINRSYTFELPESSVYEENPSYQEFSIDGLSVIFDEGLPSLPSYVANFYIPDGQEIESVNVTVSNKISTVLKRKILPVQEKERLGLGSEDLDFISPDTDVYGSSSAFPEKIAEVIRKGHMDLTKKIATVRITPFQYWPALDRFEFYGNVNISITLKPSTTNTAMLAPATSGKSDILRSGILKSVVDNPEDVAMPDGEEQYVANYAPTNNASRTLGYEYVIVTSEALADAFEPWLKWKRQKGLDAGIVTMEYIESVYDGDEISGIYDSAGKLRQFLYESYMQGTVYALLGGDISVVPMRKGCDQFNGENENFYIPTDLYFAEFNSNWDLDKDGIYGEHDTYRIDYEQEIYIGRILCSNEQEVKNWIEKALIYEQNPGFGDYDYLKKAFFTETDNMQRDNEGINVHTHFPQYTTFTLFSEEYNGIKDYNSPGLPQHPTNVEVLEEFNKNYGLTSFMGHGNAVSVAVATVGVNKSDETNFKYNLYSYDNVIENDINYSNGGSLADMDNFGYPNINYSISCNNLAYDGFSSDFLPFLNAIFAKFMTASYKSGSVAFLGNTRYGYDETSTDLFERFGDAIQNGYPSLGVAEAISKVGFSDDYIIYSHNLLGCPEMKIWTDIPETFSPIINYDENNKRLTVNANVPGCRLCVMSTDDNGESYHQVVENASSYTFHNIEAPFSLVICKEGYIPFIYGDHVYVQNQEFRGVSTVKGENISIGRNVTDYKPEGDVIIRSGANVTFEAENEVVIESGFTLEKGAVMEIK